VHHQKTEKPAPAFSEPASNHEHLGGRLTERDTLIAAAHQAEPVRCELIGSNGATALGLTVKSSRSPAFELCRRLMATGANPEAALECFRGAVLALRVSSIETGAALDIRETPTEGPRIARWKAFSRRAVEPPIRRIEQAVSSALSRAKARE
jgi:hypothetical protein